MGAKQTEEEVLFGVIDGFRIEEKIFEESASTCRSDERGMARIPTM